MNKKYRATTQFINDIRNCNYSGRQLMEMMEAKFKEYASAGYPERLEKMNKLKEKMGKDKHGNVLFGCVLTEIPIHIKRCCSYGTFLAHNDKEMYSSYTFLAHMFRDSIEATDYCAVHNMFDDFLLNMNKPLVSAV